MHGMEWVWLIMVSPLMVSHVNWDGRVKRWEEVVGTCECKEERQITNLKINTLNDDTFLKAGKIRRVLN